MGASINDLKFIVDENVGKLARWLRMMGFDSVFFTGEDDAQMVRQALAENRILLTRDTGIIKRRAVSSHPLYHGRAGGTDAPTHGATGH
jgi:uncharacterized protein with PIN domain